MAFNMKEVASLRGDEKKFAENFSKIDWSGASKEKEVCKKCDNCEKNDAELVNDYGENLCKECDFEIEG